MGKQQSMKIAFVFGFSFVPEIGKYLLYESIMFKDCPSINTNWIIAIQRRMFFINVMFMICIRIKKESVIR